MQKNEIKKDLYKSKELAYLHSYKEGELFYRVRIFNGIYEFPVHVVEMVSYRDHNSNVAERMELAADVGSTAFLTEMEGRHLNRWIDRAVEDNTLVLVGKIEEPTEAKIVKLEALTYTDDNTLA